MGLFSFLGGLLGGGSLKSGYNKAAAAQVDYLGRGIGAENAQYDQSRSDFMPWMNFGQSALGQLGDLLGMNGNDATAKAIAALKQSPIFTSLFNTGQEAVLQNASATGGLRGGNAERSLYELGNNTLAQVMQQQIANLFGASGEGLGATGSVATLGANKADMLAKLFSGQGDALASKYLGKAGVNANMWKSAGGFLDQVVSALMPGGVGGIF